MEGESHEGFVRLSTEHPESPRPTTSEKKKSLIAQHSTLFIVFMAVIGVLAGILLSNIKASSELVSWIALPGDLFIRALKCVVLPLVFVNVFLAVLEMVAVGKAADVGWKTIALYLTTTVLAAIEGALLVLIFKSWFNKKTEDPVDSTPIMQLTCPSSSDAFLVEFSNGTVGCATDLSESATLFTLNDVNGVLANVESGIAEITMSQTVQDGLFRKTIPGNIIEDFAGGNFVGVIAFAIAFGVAASKQSAKNPKNTKYLVGLFKEIDAIFISIIEFIIKLTPWAVFSLVAGALGANDDIGQVFSDLGTVIIAFIVGCFCHIFFVYCSIFWILVRENPFAYLAQIIPAQTMAFACSSSAATLPVTTKCVKNTRQVPDTVANFVLSLGATINMDGSSIYFPIALVYLGMSEGHAITIPTIILIVILCTLGSMGAAPVPSAGLVLILSCYQTVFDDKMTPVNFSYIIAIDWFADRIQTMLNITGDTIVARCVSKLADVDMIEQAAAALNKKEEA